MDGVEERRRNRGNAGEIERGGRGLMTGQAVPKESRTLSRAECISAAEA
jgi:hypothetical protein